MDTTFPSFIPPSSVPGRIHEKTSSLSFHDDPYGSLQLEENLAAEKRVSYKQNDAISSTSSNIAFKGSPVQPPSKFFDKVNTNYVPNMAERQEIAEYITTVNQELSDLDAKTKEISSAFWQVVRTRHRLQTSASQHQALISPLRRLPPELLQSIFVCCLPSHRNAVMHASEAPVLLGRVCSEWRQISLSTPEVWSSLHIVPPNVNVSNLTASAARFKRKRELIEMWLGRSGACPLNISFVWFASNSEDETRLCASLLEALVPMCRRWQMLDFQVPLKMFTPFIGLTVKDVPLLEGLSLTDNRPPSVHIDVVDRWPESLMFAENLTNLKNFSLTFFSGAIWLPSIPWHQLSTLYLESNISFFFQDSREMLSTLAQCSHLESCTLKFPLSHTSFTSTFEKLDQPITLPQLQALCLDGDQHLQSTFHMSNTLINLCAPKLRKLEIFGRSRSPEGNIVPEPLTAIRMLLERSKCPLEKLSVASMSLSEEFIACLKLVPTLLELVVQNWAVRMQLGPQSEDVDYEYNHLAENRVLRALTIAASCPQRVPVVPAWKQTQKRRLDRVAEGEGDEGEGDEVLEEESESASGVKTGEDLVSTPPPRSSESKDPILSLCPNLQRFDFTLSDASQTVLCDFVESRWVSPPPGVAHIKSIKCIFTAFEDEMVKRRLAGFKAEGLDVFVTYRIPVSEDMIPSPWTGLEVPGILHMPA